MLVHSLFSKRQCQNVQFGGEECLGEPEKKQSCFLRECFCDLTDWSAWGKCVALENGCGKGIKIRTRKNNTDTICILKEGKKGELEEEKECFTKHCTNEFFLLNSITFQILEAEYPGTSTSWEVSLLEENGEHFCKTSTLYRIDRSRTQITGNTLGSCRKRKINKKEFHKLEKLQLKLEPRMKIKDDNIMKVTDLSVRNCDLTSGGSYNKWNVGVNSKCTMNNYATGFVLGKWNDNIPINNDCNEMKFKWTDSFRLNFYSNGNDAMAICEAKMTLQGHLSRKDYKHLEALYGKLNLYDKVKKVNFVIW